MARIDGELKSAQPEILSSLPAGPQPLNRIVQFGGNIYTWNGTIWTKLISEANVAASFLFLSPNTTSYITAGAFNHGTSYWFIVNAANATIGATYTNNGMTLQVVRSITAGTQLLLKANTAGNPLASGTLTKASGTGDATITFTSFRAPIGSIVELIGGGGGGGGSGTTSGAVGGAGGSSLFSTFASAIGGSGGGWSGSGGSGAGGSGGILNSPAVLIYRNQGSSGMSTGNALTGTFIYGAMGGAGFYGGTSPQSTGSATILPVGRGCGGNGGGSGASTATAGNGGGSGEYVKFWNPNPTALYSVTVGGGGIAGVATTNGFAGALGSTGLVMVTDYFQ